MTVLYEEKSQRTRSAELLVVFFVILLLCAAAYTTYRSIQLHTVLLAEMCIRDRYYIIFYHFHLTFNLNCVIMRT